VLTVAVIVTVPPTGTVAGAVNTVEFSVEVWRGLNEDVPHEAAGVQVQATPSPLFPEVPTGFTMAVTSAVVLTAIVVGA
jgi:multisubunit Na+/H+ antiporter MnhC subunit